MRFQATHKLVTYLLVLSAVATLASTDALPAASGLAFLVAWALSWTVDAGGRAAALLDRIGAPLRVAMLAVCGVTAWQVWRRLPEPDLTPVLHLVLTLLAYKLLHRRGNRDYLHIYVLSFLLVLAASALAGSFVFAAAFGVYVVLATWTLILFHLRREMEENYLVKHSAQAPSQKVGVGRILNSRRVVGGAFFAATGAVALAVFAGAVATFTLVPRVGAGFVFGAARPSANLIGFSDDVSLGHYGVLSADNPTVALRATVPRIAALASEAARDREIERLYWRGTVYDRYAQGHWTRSRDPALRTVLEDGGTRTWLREPAVEAAHHPAPWPPLAEAERQEIDVVGVPVPVAFALDRPLAFELPAARLGAAGELRLTPRWSGEVALRLAPFGPFGLAGAADEEDPPRVDLHPFLGTHYVAYSTDTLTRARAASARAVADLPPAVRAAYLSLPGSLSGRVAEKARQLTAGATTAPGKLVALLDWLRASHEYTLRLPRHPPGVDPVEDFLFERRSGHCEYFASAMVVLLRAADIPARYVNGYLGGEWNGIGRYISVRDNRAHSWAEAYLGEVGWVRVDATPPAPGGARAGRLRQLFESLDFYWTRWVVGYDLDRQLDLARRLGRRLGVGGGGEAPGRGVPGWALVLAAVAALAVVASRRWPPAATRRCTAFTGARWTGWRAPACRAGRPKRRGSTPPGSRTPSLGAVTCWSSSPSFTPPPGSAGNRWTPTSCATCRGGCRASAVPPRRRRGRMPALRCQIDIAAGNRPPSRHDRRACARPPGARERHLLCKHAPGGRAVMNRRSLILLGAFAVLLAAGPARAQTGGTTGTTGTGGTTGATSLSASDFFIGVQHQQGSNLSDFDVARFFNKANCDCDETVFVYATLVASGFAKRSLQMTGNVEFWIGTSCDNVLLQKAQCAFLKSEPIATFFQFGHETLQTSARVMSTNTATGTTTVDADGGVTTTTPNGTFTPTTTCTAPNAAQFSQSIYLLVDYNADRTYDVVVTRAVSVDLTPPPQPSNVAVTPGNEALNVSWTGVDAALYPDLLGYQILCKRGENLQVFNNGTFGAGFKSCPATSSGSGPEGLEASFVCSPLLSRLTKSFRVKILQNGITYGATVVSIDNSGNASAPDLFYGTPIKTKSFYDVYRDGNETNGGPGQQPTPGGASGGFCGVARGTPRGLAAIPVGVALAGLSIAARRRRRRR